MTGWEYMIIEKMDKPFWSFLDDVMADSGNAKEVDLSELARQLIEHTESVHKKRHIIIDVKPDNFMFAMRTSKSQTHAELLRFVDLGLWKLIQKDDEGKAKSFTGNDLYCSLNMQKLNHPSRADDLQMIVLVIAEMAIRLRAKLHGETDKYEKTPIPSYLPWSHCANQQNVFQCKEDKLMNPDSEFYQRMPPSCAATIHKLIQKTQEISFNQKPDYNEFIDELGSFAVPKPAKRKVAPRTKRVPKSSLAAEAKPAGRVTRASARHSRSSPTEEEKDSKPPPRKRPALDRHHSPDEESTDDPMEVEPLDDNGIVVEGQENMGISQSNRDSKRAAKASASSATMEIKDSLRVTIKQQGRGGAVLHSFDVGPQDAFVLGSGNSSSRSKKATRYSIPVGEPNHCSVKLVGMKPKPGERQCTKILAIEVEHTAKTGSTEFGDNTLSSSNKKKSLGINKIHKGRITRESTITIGDVAVTFERL
jgi:serine/threonine protein kinase